MLYVCLECGHIFDEDDVITWKEYRGECFGYPAYEEFMGSPCCKENYAEAKECSCCGKYIIGSYIKTDNGDRFCEDCYVTMELGDED